MNLLVIFWNSLPIIVGSWALYVAQTRVRTTREMRARILTVASNLWRDAVETNQQNERTLIKLHNLLIDTAALAPMIASGLVVMRRDTSMTREERDEVEDLFNRNAWLLAYMTAAHMAIVRMQFHARPWNPRLSILAGIAAIEMQLFSTEDGGVEFNIPTPSNAAESVDDMVRLNTKDHLDRLAGAH